MLRALLVAAILAAPTAASAGVYIGLGIGTTGVNDSSTATSNTFTDNGRSWRGDVGYRFQPFALGSITPALSIEGGYQGFNVGLMGARITSPFDGQEFFAAGKFSVPFNPLFEAYARLGFEHSSFTSQTNIPHSELDGTGWLGGVGVEFRLGGIVGAPPVFRSSGIWVDFTYNGNSMTDYANKSRDIGVDMFTIGLTFGF
jgi:hypothetical protein